MLEGVVYISVLEGVNRQHIRPCGWVVGQVSVVRETSLVAGEVYQILDSGYLVIPAILLLVICSIEIHKWNRNVQYGKVVQLLVSSVTSDKLRHNRSNYVLILNKYIKQEKHVT